MKKATMTKSEPNVAAGQLRPQDVDRYLGCRLRTRRIMLGLTQQDLAGLIGVTYQQQHKYEKGINRISGGRLFQMARALGVDVAYFYDGLQDSRPVAPSRLQRLLFELSRNFTDIRNHHVQDSICALVRVLAAPGEGTKMGDVVGVMPDVDTGNAT